MAIPLTWDTPGLKFDAPGATWDGEAARPRTMKKTKAIIDFTSYTGPELATTVQTIHDQMTANAVTFPTPTTTMAALQTEITDYEAKLAAKASRSTADIVAFNVARHDLEGTLRDLGGYVNLVAQGSEAIVVLSGFPSYGGLTPLPSTIPAAPTNLRLRHGDLSGSIVARYHPDRQNSMNQVMINTGDPNNEAGWVPAGTFGGGKASISGLTVGGTVWVRVRTVLKQNVNGPWSDPAKIVVL